MAKSPDAFRTISEVAEWLGIQAHVLRFWESKFTQVRPVKRAGGRRYYRPNDMLLLGGIKQLLHEDGLTIKGVQKVLREEGMSHVAAMSVPLDELTQSQLEEAPEAGFTEAVEEPAEEKGVVLSFDAAPAKAEAEPEPAPEPEMSSEPEPASEPAPEPQEPETSVTAAKADVVETTQEESLETAASEPTATDSDEALVEEIAKPEQSAPDTPQEAPVAAKADASEAAEPASEETTADLPAFLRRPMPDQPAPTDNAPAEASPPAAAPEPPTAAPETPPESAKPTPRKIDMPALTPEHEFAAAPAALSAVYRTRHLSTEQAKQIAPLLNKLTVLRDSMAAPRKGAANAGSTNGPNA